VTESISERGDRLELPRLDECAVATVKTKKEKKEKRNWAKISRKQISENQQASQGNSRMASNMSSWMLGNRCDRQNRSKRKYHGGRCVLSSVLYVLVENVTHFRLPKEEDGIVGIRHKKLSTEENEAVSRLAGPRVFTSSNWRPTIPRFALCFNDIIEPCTIIINRCCQSGYADRKSGRSLIPLPSLTEGNLSMRKQVYQYKYTHRVTYTTRVQFIQ
jgi:hypothetical protein